MQKFFHLLCFTLCVLKAHAQLPFFSFSMSFGAPYNISSPLTVNGQSYAMKVSGTFSVWCCYTPLDAAYKFLDETNGNPISPTPLIVWTWNGITPGASNAFRPTPDVYDSAHEY